MSICQPLRLPVDSSSAREPRKSGGNCRYFCPVGFLSSALLTPTANSRSRYPVSNFPSWKSRSARIRRNSEILVLIPPTKYSFQRAQPAATSPALGRSVADQFRQQRIVVHRHGPAFVHAAIEPDARARGAPDRDLSRAGEIIVVRIFRVDTAFDRVPANQDVFLLKGKLLALRRCESADGPGPVR